jgi:hypothetical protein
MMTDGTGAKIGEQGHFPFGESWYANNTTTKWGFTTYERDSESNNDYALARVGKEGGAVEPTARFWIMKHFTDLTPHQSEVLATSSGEPGVLYSAFRKGAGPDSIGAGYTLHILNLGPPRRADLDGLPDANWQVAETTEAAQYQQKPLLRSKTGKLLLHLPAKSLITLTLEPPP